MAQLVYTTKNNLSETTTPSKATQNTHSAKKSCALAREISNLFRVRGATFANFIGRKRKQKPKPQPGKKSQ